MLLQQHSSTAWASDDTMHEDRSLDVTAVLSTWMPGMSGTRVVKAGSGGKFEPGSNLALAARLSSVWCKELKLVQLTRGTHLQSGHDACATFAGVKAFLIATDS